MADSLGQTILNAWESAIQGSVEVLTGAIGLVTTARQSIRTVASLVAQAASQSTLNTVMSQFQDVPISPAVLADAVIRNLITPDAAAAEAAYSGLNPDRFNLLTLDTGESYGIDQAVRLWWRGTHLGPEYGISEDELKTVIYYSRVRDQFIPDLELLAYETMSTADALTAVVKGHLSAADGLTYFVAAGGMPDQFDVLLASSGDSIGVVSAVNLHAHGLITDADLQAVIDQSRINPECYDVAMLTTRKWLPAYQIEKAVAAGTVDLPTALTWMTEEGYSEDQATAFIEMSASGTVKTVKSVTEGQILADFEAEIISEADATTALEALGYQASAVPFILDSIVAKRVNSMRNAAVSRLRTAFVNSVMDEATVKTGLLSLGLPSQAVDQFLTYWTIEAQTNVKRLSMAQVGKLHEDGVFADADAVTRWTQMGYTQADAEYLLLLYPAAAAAPPATTSTTPATGS